MRGVTAGCHSYPSSHVPVPPQEPTLFQQHPRREIPFCRVCALDSFPRFTWKPPPRVGVLPAPGDTNQTHEPTLGRDLCQQPFRASVPLEQDSEQQAAASISLHHSHLCPADRVVALTWSRGRGPCPSAFSNHVPEETVTQLSQLRPRPGPAQPSPSPWPSAGRGPANSHLLSHPSPGGVGGRAGASLQETLAPVPICVLPAHRAAT